MMNAKEMLVMTMESRAKCADILDEQVAEFLEKLEEEFMEAAKKGADFASYDRPECPALDKQVYQMLREYGYSVRPNRFDNALMYVEWGDKW